eukprot:2367759-Amphidinium_carterae.1
MAGTELREQSVLLSSSAVGNHSLPKGKGKSKGSGEGSFTSQTPSVHLRSPGQRQMQQRPPNSAGVQGEYASHASCQAMDGSLSPRTILPPPPPFPQGCNEANAQVQQLTAVLAAVPI